MFYLDAPSYDSPPQILPHKFCVITFEQTTYISLILYHPVSYLALHYVSRWQHVTEQTKKTHVMQDPFEYTIKIIDYTKVPKT
jgi:hypothetical protein